MATLADAGLWVVAVVVGAAPRRLWRHLEPPLPLAATAYASGLLAFFVGFIVGIPAFFRYAERAADVNNTWMLRAMAENPSVDPHVITKGVYGRSALTFFAFLFFTPLGWLTIYLIASGGLRAVSAGVADDARGDFVLSGLHWGVTSLSAAMKTRRRERTRAQQEGEEVADVLATGEWAGLNADLVVISSRQKPEWTAGAIVMTRTDWYRLGDPLETETPAGLRMLYPLTKLEATEVVRRGIEYELPRLTRRASRSGPR
jgi:hypothetical protein